MESAKHHYSGKFLGFDDPINLYVTGGNGYDYEKVKKQIHAESMDPGLQVFIFIIVGLFFSACLVCCISCYIYRDNLDELTSIFKREPRVEDNQEQFLGQNNR